MPSVAGRLTEGGVCWLPPPTPELPSTLLRAPLSAATLSDSTFRHVSFTSRASPRVPAIGRVLGRQPGAELPVSPCAADVLHFLQRSALSAQPHGCMREPSIDGSAVRGRGILIRQRCSVAGVTCEATRRQGPSVPTAPSARMAPRQVSRFATISTAVAAQHMVADGASGERLTGREAAQPEEASQVYLPEAQLGQRRHRRFVERCRFWRTRWEGLVHYGKHLASGAMSAVVSRSAVAPFERVKMELLLHQNTGKAGAVAGEILRREGVYGFWRGNTLNLMRTAPYKAVNFASYDAFKLLLRGSDPTVELSKFKGFVAGAMAGVTACITCFPLDLLRTRILADPSSSAGIAATLRSILRTEGFTALYGGCLPALMSVGPSGAVFYGVYDLLKNKHLDDLRRQDEQAQERLSGMYTLLYGAIAGGTAESVVYPLIVVQRRMQLANMQAAQQAGKQGAAALARKGGLSAMQSAAVALYKAQGLGGFYIGYLPNIMQVLPNAALSYYAYETFKAALAVQ